MKSGRKGNYSAEVIREIRQWHKARSALPTPSQMRKRHRMSKSFLRMICAGFVYKGIE